MFRMLAATLVILATVVPHPLAERHSAGQNADASQVQANDAFSFAWAAIDALALFRSAQRSLLAAQQSSTAIGGALVDTRIAVQKLRQAQTRLQRHTNADSEQIAEAAKTLVGVYGALAGVNQRFITLEEGMLRASTEAQVTELMIDSTKLAADANQLYEALAAAQAMGAHALVDPARLKGQSRSYLKISAAQLSQLKEHTRLTVGPPPAKPKTTSELAESLWWEFLNQPWLTADSK